jgi:hypothetical protein
MMPQYHVLVSTLISATFLFFACSLLAVLLCLLDVSLIDADHLLDFWMYNGRATITGEIFTNFYE